jgi:hypothetical protein
MKGASLMTSTVVAPKIVGKALYLELVGDKATHGEEGLRKLLGWQAKAVKQVILFPEYQDDTGKVWGAVIMERTVSEYRPKAQWDTTYIDRQRVKPYISAEPSGHMKDYVTHGRYSNAEWESLTQREVFDSRKTALGVLLKNMTIQTTWSEPENEGDERKLVATQVYKVREDKPISVEITDQDMSDLHMVGKTPQAVIRRINKVRGTLDKFPAKLA